MVELPSYEQVLEQPIHHMHGIRVVEMLQEPKEGLLSPHLCLKVSNCLRPYQSYFLKKEGEVMFQRYLFEDRVPILLSSLLININRYSL